MGSWTVWGHTAKGTKALCGVSSDTPSSSLGLCLGWLSSSSHWAQPGCGCPVAVPQAGGDARLSQQLGCLSEASSRSSSSSFLLPDRSLKFKAGLLQAQRGKNETNKGGRGCGHRYAKTIPLGAASWSKPSLFGGQLQLPSSAGCSQSCTVPWQRGLVQLHVL